MNAPLRPAPTIEADRLTTYRPFIDGLRAVSILAVVGYHVGIPGFSGGYVGVDIFFVISGFLIISQITEGLDQGRFSFADFWARRALRILPPYLLVIVVIALAAPSILIMPEDLQDFGQQVAYSAGMFVNHLFLVQQGYFDGPVETKVLLNLWSLSVEEQFYLFTPLLLAGLYLLIRRAPPGTRDRILWWATAVVFLVSLIACIALTAGPESRNPGFYLMPLRAWEFVAGGAIGLILPLARRMPPAAQSALAPGGLLAVAISVFAYSPALRYPSAYALLPVLGAAAVILGGILRPEGAAPRLLATPPMVAIGLVSYSWYLWHWPLLAYGRILNFGERDLTADLVNALLSLGLAALTYALVERPIRRLRQSGRIGLGWRPVAAGIAACAVVATAGGFGFQLLGRDAALTIPAKYLPFTSSSEPVCDLQTATSAADCLGPAAGRPLGLLIGDSMIQQPRDVIVQAGQARGSFELSYISSGCGAVLGVDIFIYDQAMRHNCTVMRGLGEKVLAELEALEQPPRYALLYSNWPVYHDGRGGAALGVAGSGVAAADQDAFFVESLRNTVAILNGLGIERVLVVGPTPVFRRLVPTCLTLADRYGADHDVACALSRSEVEEARQPTQNLMLAALSGLPGVRYIDPAGEFCDAELCRPWAGDQILVIDRQHLSNAGLQRIVDAHRADFDWMFGAAH